MPLPHPSSHFVRSLLTRFRVALSVLSLAAAISSCTTVRYPLIPEAAGNPKPGEGWIVATFSAESFDRAGKSVRGSGVASVRAKHAQSGELAILTPRVVPPDGNPNFPGKERASEVVAVPVPAGNYSITGWIIQDQAVTAGVTFTNRLPIDVPFQVRPGEATYVGRIRPVSIYGKNILGMRVPGDAFVFITDDFQEDARRISNFYPSIRRSSIQNSDVPAGYKREMIRTAETPEKFLGLF